MQLNSNDREIYHAIQQLDGSGCMRGYQAMWHTLRLDYGWEYGHQEDRWKEFDNQLILKEKPCERLMH